MLVQGYGSASPRWVDYSVCCSLAAHMCAFCCAPHSSRRSIIATSAQRIDRVLEGSQGGQSRVDHTEQCAALEVPNKHQCKHLWF